MSVTCHRCGKESQDLEFCDYCNADLEPSGPGGMAPERCPLLEDGEALTDVQRHVLSFPESSILVEADGKPWRVHWLSTQEREARGHLLERRLALQIPALPYGYLLDDVDGQWLVFEAMPETIPPWIAPPLDEPLQELQRLSACLHSLALMLESLHQNSFVWLNFDPNALEVVGALPANARGSGDWLSLRIMNLDLELFPFQSMPERVRVHPHFAAPEIVQFRGEDIDPRTDVFHLAGFTYYWLAGQMPNGLAGDGPESNDFTLPFLRIFAPKLPAGIVSVVTRGLAFQPQQRHATPQAFVHALDEAIIAAYRRRSFAGPIRWQIGGTTRTGRSKAERGNEDFILIKDDGQSATTLVADGVSTCDIGSGGLASMMTSIVIENALADGCTHESFPEIITGAARRGSQGLLEWALAHDCRDDLAAGKDLMGTTLTVGWLQGRELSLANLGDSRAYLITDDFVEQLTVDGDLASDLLAQRMAPEEIRELGVMARALRQCVGGCTVADNGEPCVMPESCVPSLTRWPLLPGDIVVLCTDGLVEEGFFLEPANLAEIVRANKDRPAAEIALMLAEAADALQRVPSIVEPDGFGDNISSVVIKITA